MLGVTLENGSLHLLKDPLCYQAGTLYPFPSIYVLFMLLWAFQVSICLPLVISLAL